MLLCLFVNIKHFEIVIICESEYTSWYFMKCKHWKLLESFVRLFVSSYISSSLQPFISKKIIGHLHVQGLSIFLWKQQLLRLHWEFFFITFSSSFWGFLFQVIFGPHTSINLGISFQGLIGNFILSSHKCCELAISISSVSLSDWCLTYHFALKAKHLWSYLAKIALNLLWKDVKLNIYFSLFQYKWYIMVFQ